MCSLAPFLRFAHDLADLARPIARETWLAPPQVDYKADGSLLTQADLSIERAWRDSIAARFPDHGILGEEFGYSKGATFTWLLDPIDGTRPFGLGLTDFATLIALCRDGRPVLGMIDLPLMDARYWASAGDGAYLNGRALRVSGHASLDQSKAALANHNSFTGESAATYEAFRARAGTAVFDAGSPAYGALAAGKLDLVLNAHDLNAHDICALVPVVEEAGGHISDWQGRALTMQSEGGVLATASASLHAAALNLIQESWC